MTAHRDELDEVKSTRGLGTLQIRRITEMFDFEGSRTVT